MRSRSTGTDWLAGLVVGAAGGVLLAAWPTLGLLVILGFGIAAAFSGRSVAAFGGLLTGIPATWLAIIWVAEARCRAFDAQPGSDCVFADVSGWFLAAGATLVIGAGLTIAAARRAARRNAR